MESARIEYLWRAMALLPTNPEASHILRCHFMSVCRSLDEDGCSQMPKKITRKSSMCQYCSNVWKYGLYTTKMLAERKPPKSIEKIIARYNKDPNCLRKFEVGLAKKYARRKNKWVITCGVCQKETKFDVSIPESKVRGEDEDFEEEMVTEAKKRKKRYSKDPTAGLKIPPNFHAKENVDEKHEQGMISKYSDEVISKSQPVTPSSSKRVKKIVDDNTPLFTESIKVSKTKKKKNRLEDDAHQLSNFKNHCKQNILKKVNSTPPNHSLQKLLKNNKMSSMFSKASPNSESPLAKFLSSL